LWGSFSGQAEKKTELLRGGLEQNIYDHGKIRDEPQGERLNLVNAETSGEPIDPEGDAIQGRRKP